MRWTFRAADLKDDLMLQWASEDAVYLEGMTRLIHIDFRISSRKVRVKMYS
jgi:hypothetical protein